MPEFINEFVREQRLDKFWWRKLPGAVGFKSLLLAREMRCVEQLKAKGCYAAYQSISEHILHGRPLTFAEFHLAIAFRLLLTDLDYETFYRTRWHETDKEIGYGPLPKCKGTTASSSTRRAAKTRKRASAKPSKSRRKRARVS